MAYTNDPANKPSDQVRFYVGDTDVASPDLTDEEVAFLLLEENDNTLRAAARAAETLAAKYTKRADSKKVGPLAIIQSNRANTKAQEFGRLAAWLWARAGAGNAGPYAGGISVSDKNSRILDSDRVRPAFSRSMMRERSMGVADDTTEERLASPEIQP